MLCHGGLILLKSPGQIVGVVEGEKEKCLKDPETRLGHCKRVVRNQLFDSNSDKSRIESVLKPTSLDSLTFKGKRLGPEKAKPRASELSNVSRSEDTHDELSNRSKKTRASNASNKQDQSLGCERFTEKSSLNAQVSSDEDWRSLSRALASGPKVSAISNHDLMRIAELRFSTDMNEGNSGSQVVLLQKSLFWLGHLSKQSDITGYFGLETKQALQEFQEAHGVSQTGVWGPLSKQALWHTISAEILHRAVDEKSSKSSEVRSHETRSPSNVFTQVWQSWTPMKLPDVFRTAMSEGDWRLLSAIAFLLVGIFIGLLISKVSPPPLQSNLVKRRIVRSTESEKPNSHSRDQKQEMISSNSNGAAGVSNTSQLTSKTPAYTTELGATGQADASAVHVKKVLPGSMYVSSLGHGVQNGSPKQSSLSNKGAYASGVTSTKAGSFKAGAESMRGKQQGPWSRPLRQSGWSFKMREESKLQPLARSSWETTKLNRQDKESTLPMPTSKGTFADQKDDLSRPSKRFDNDFCFTKDDGAAVVMQGEDEPNVRKRIEELRKAVEAAEQNGQSAVLALAEERKRSRELEGKISIQRESAAALEEEVRVLKESHDALLESLRKKTGPATRGASLLYQDFKNDGNNGVS